MGIHRDFYYVLLIISVTLSIRFSNFSGCYFGWEIRPNLICNTNFVSSFLLLYAYTFLFSFGIYLFLKFLQLLLIEYEFFLNLFRFTTFFSWIRFVKPTFRGIITADEIIEIVLYSLPKTLQTNKNAECISEERIRFYI